MSKKIFDIDFNKYSPFLRLVSQFEERVSAFLKEYTKRLVQAAERSIKGGYKRFNDPRAKDVVKNLKILQVRNVKSKLKKSKNPKDVFKEEYGYVLIVANVSKKFSELHSKKNVVVKFVSNGRSKTRGMDNVTRFLIRYSPWIPDLIPHLPKNYEVTTLFVKVRDEEYRETYLRNEKNMSKLYMVMKANKIPIKKKKVLKKYLVGIEDLQYWILRNEFGIDARKVPVWKNMLTYITTKAYLRILLDNDDLGKTLIDPTFRDYKKFLKDDKMIDREELSDYFQNKLLS